MISGGGKPTYARGWIRFFESDDWDEPVEVARYQVPEAGTHNLWVDEDKEILHVAFYNGAVHGSASIFSRPFLLATSCPQML